MNFPKQIVTFTEAAQVASFGKHLHAAPNSKLAKYAESTNFAYLSKRQGLRPFKGPNQKTFGRSTISAKITPRGFDLLKVRTKKPSAEAQ